MNSLSALSPLSSTAPPWITSSPEQDSHALSLALDGAFQTAPVGLCVMDLSFRYVSVNARFTALYGLPASSFLGHTVTEALPNQASQLLDHLNRVLEGESLVEVEITLPDPGGSAPGTRPRLLTYLRTAQPLWGANGRMIAFSVALLDITERKRAEEALIETDENLRYTVELTPHIPWTADAHGELTSMSPRWHTVTGRTPEVVLLRNWVMAIHPQDRGYVTETWMNSVRTGNPYDAEYRIKSADGSWRWMRARAFPRYDHDGAILRWYGTVEDIHARKMVEEALHAKTVYLEEMTEELAQRSREDHLTGLANRRYFDEVLSRETGRALRMGLPLALIMIDIDHFKRFNDTYGHIAGDECLRAVANELKQVLRQPGDMAARYGGEEFAMILPNTTEEVAIDVAENAGKAVRDLCLQAGLGVAAHVTLSAGVGLLSSRGNLPNEIRTADLIAAADSALYDAKAKGRDCVTAHTPSTQSTRTLA